MNLAEYPVPKLVIWLMRGGSLCVKLGQPYQEPRRDRKNPEHRAISDFRRVAGPVVGGLHAQLLALARHWSAVWIVVDATGVGAGLASFLHKALGEKVLPITFSPKLKSDLGWNFLAVVETGRYQDCQDDGEPDLANSGKVTACQYQVRDGPGKLMSWCVWETSAYDGLIAYGHDDLLTSASLISSLDQQPWPGTDLSAVLCGSIPKRSARPKGRVRSGADHQPDPLDEIDTSDW